MTFFQEISADKFVFHQRPVSRTHHDGFIMILCMSDFNERKNNIKTWSKSIRK